jgi:O-antigen ligase
MIPPPVALVIYLGFVAWLFRRDFRQRPNVTGALWIPFIWMFIIMTRFVSSWLDMFGIHVGGSSVEEGSPVDALGSLILIIAGAVVLSRRGLNVPELLRRNQWLTIFFIYCFLAVFWSDFPFISFKRWIKILGQPITVLVLFTEPDFETALIVLMKRLAYIIVPVSILFIKYFPDLGRGFSEWTGQGLNKGITLGKNDLGVDAFILGLFFVWYALKLWKMEKSKFRRNELMLCGGFIYLCWWLLQSAQSSTALVSCLISVTLLLALGIPGLRRENVGTYIICTVLVVGVAEYVFGISDLFFEVLGKDRTMTDRTKVWQDCLSIPINPIIGTGFESFWMGDRLDLMWQKWYWHPNEAHNGYLETYLNLGLIGLGILVALILATFWKARREYLFNFHFGRYRVAFLCALVVYNWTEASFKALHPMWFVFYIVALDYPKGEAAAEPLVEDVSGTLADAAPEETPGQLGGGPDFVYRE